MDTQAQFVEIDHALLMNDIKRAEVAIARRLRRKNTIQERSELLFRRAQARLLSARPDDALEDIETGLALYPPRAEQVETRVLIGDIYFARFELAPVGFVDRTDSETALTCYLDVVGHNPDYEQIGRVYYQIGRIYLSQNDSESAHNYFEKVLSSPCNPANIHALACERIGVINLLETRNPAQALEYFRRAQESYPPDGDPGWMVQLHIRISRAYLDLEQHEAALEAARKALREIQDGTTHQHRASLPDAHMAIADILAVMTGHEDEAIEHYLRFLQSSKRPPGIDVTWSHVHETIGQLSFRLERYQQAIDAFEKALELNPYHPWEVNVRYQIARCYYRMRIYEKTIASIEKMRSAADAENSPITDWRVFNLLGNACFALEKYERAVDAYRKAIELAPAATDALNKMHIYLRFSEELSQSP
ncbi:MAG TPA: tetratricopeptide repeat protein, partial [Aggregatilineales bacterium]|nr:tetratricopeptide repeat protein [Aggregatilineales bacterium]